MFLLLLLLRHFFVWTSSTAVITLFCFKPGKNHVRLIGEFVYILTKRDISLDENVLTHDNERHDSLYIYNTSLLVCVTTAGEACSSYACIAWQVFGYSMTRLLLLSMCSMAGVSPQQEKLAPLTHVLHGRCLATVGEVYSSHMLPIWKQFFFKYMYSVNLLVSSIKHMTPCWHRLADHEDMQT